MKTPQLILMLLTSDEESLARWSDIVFQLTRDDERQNRFESVGLAVAVKGNLLPPLVARTQHFSTVTNVALDVHTGTMLWPGAMSASYLKRNGASAVVINHQRWRLAAGERLGWTPRVESPEQSERAMAKLQVALKHGLKIILCGSGGDNFTHAALGNELNPFLDLLADEPVDRYCLVRQRSLVQAGSAPYERCIRSDIGYLEDIVAQRFADTPAPATFYAPANPRSGDTFEVEALVTCKRDVLGAHDLALDLTLEHPDEDARHTLELIKELAAIRAPD